MGFWKNLFGIKESIEIPEQKQEIITDLPKEILKLPEEKISPALDKPCEICNKIIGEERYKKIAGKFYHKSCYKDYTKKLKAAGKIF